METTSNVARFIAARIEATGQLQKDIAAKVGFEKPNIITMLKQGKTRLPLNKAGPMALALETDPVQLFSMCLEEYYPETWKTMALCMETALTRDELRLIMSLRAAGGAPFLSALSEESQTHLSNYLESLRSSPSAIH